MIGTAAMPMTTLSAKLITMNRNRSAMISQAWRGAATGCAVAAAARIAAPGDRDVWAVMAPSVQSGQASADIWIPVGC